MGFVRWYIQSQRVPGLARILLSRMHCGENLGEQKGNLTQDFSL